MVSEIERKTVTSGSRWVAGSVFDTDGNLVDDKVREQLAGFVQGFAAFAGAPHD